MDIIRGLNDAVDYIESNLCAEIDPDVVAQKACVSADSFMRFFSYMTGMSLKEYIRRRKLTLAAHDLTVNDARIIDIAVKYGYDNAAAFSRAFARQHGIAPSEYRKNGGSLKIYPAASFHITVKGAQEMDFRIIDIGKMRIFGMAAEYENAGYKSREELRHIMWSEDGDDIPGKLCDGKWNEPGNTAYDGEWFGIWKDGKYAIGRERDKVKDASFEEFCIPAGKYAAFRTAPGTLAWEEFPRLFEQIFDSWLPGSGYRHVSDMIIEVLHLWTDHDERRSKRYYEVWIPVEAI